MTQMTFTPRRAATELRTGDRITHIDGRTVDYTVIADPTATGTGVVSIAVSRPGYSGPINLYPDTHVADSLTIERSTRPASIAVVDRRNAAHINKGDRLIVQRFTPRTAHGITATELLTNTRRKTGVEIATVLTQPTKADGHYRCYRITTDLGEIIADAATVYGIAA